MKRIPLCLTLVLGAALAVPGCRDARPSLDRGNPALDLAGAWRSAIHFRTGAFTGVNDLEFMYVFNGGGTMTESSNYDAAPPVPPAYGVWKRTGPLEFEAKYEFYATKPPARGEDLVTGGGWLPAGRGVFTERIALDPDGHTFRSTMRYEALDASGHPVAGGGEAEGHGTRIGF